MANLTSPKSLVLYAFQLLLLAQIQVSCYQYKVGDLDAWSIPSSANPQVYTFWSKYHSFQIGDSLCKFVIFLSSLKIFISMTKDTIKVLALIMFFFHHFQCSYTHQVKIQWFKSRNKTTTPATSKIHSCTWTTATLYLISLHMGSSTSPVGSQGTVKRSRSFAYLCFLGMDQPTLPLMVLVHCQTLQHPLTPLCLARSHCHLLIQQQTNFQSSYLPLLAQRFLQRSMASCEGHNCQQNPNGDWHTHIYMYFICFKDPAILIHTMKFWYCSSFQWFKRNKLVLNIVCRLIWLQVWSFTLRKESNVYDIVKKTKKAVAVFEPEIKEETDFHVQKVEKFVGLLRHAIPVVYFYCLPAIHELFADSPICFLSFTVL